LLETCNRKLKKNTLLFSLANCIKPFLQCVGYHPYFPVFTNRRLADKLVDINCLYVQREKSGV